MSIPSSQLAAREARETLTSDSLLATVEERAAWRKRRAEEHSDDERSASSARALKRLAAFIRANPSDPCVRGVLAVQETCPELDLSRLGEGSLHDLGGYGFARASHVDPAVFLVRLAFVLQDDVERALGAAASRRPRAADRA
jgi:hypothetical protein